MGIALKDKGQLDEAIAAYRQAIALRPTFAEAYNSLGLALKDKGRIDESVAAILGISVMAACAVSLQSHRPSG